MDFSVIMPVRNNIEGLKTALGAFQLFTAKPELVEIRLMVDRGDMDTDKYIALSGKYDIQIFVHLVEPSDNFNKDYYNAHMKYCRGKNIMAFNDDCYVQTNKWDDIVRQKIAEHPEFKGIYLVDIWDSTRFGNDSEGKKFEFPRFPMISRKAVDIAGFFFFPQMRNWPADKVVWNLYTSVGCIIKCHEVKLQHDHNFDHTGDPTKSRFLRILNEDIANGVFPIDARPQCQALYDAINN